MTDQQHRQQSAQGTHRTHRPQRTYREQHRRPRKPTSSITIPWSRLNWKKIGALLGVIVVIVIGFRACSSWKTKSELTSLGKASQSEFIKIVGNNSKSIAAKHDLYASVMIAQAILESGWGKSELTKNANNLFSITGEFKGKSYEIKSKADSETAIVSTSTEKFRKYPTYEDSLQDYANLLAKGKSWDKNYYSGAWKSKTKSYKDATSYLESRYPTSISNYASKLDALIKKYDLTRFDK